MHNIVAWRYVKHVRKEHVVLKIDTKKFKRPLYFSYNNIIIEKCSLCYFEAVKTRHKYHCKLYMKYINNNDIDFGLYYKYYLYAGHY